MSKLFTKIGTAMVGIAMAIGVGVAVGRDQAKEVNAEAGDTVTETMYFQTGLGGTASFYGATNTKGAQTLTGTNGNTFAFSDGAYSSANTPTNSSYMMFGKTDVTFKNTSAPENSYISAISWKYSSGVSTNVILGLSYDKTELSGAKNEVNQAKASTSGEVSLTPTNQDNAYFLIRVTNNYNCQFVKFSITWTEKAATGDYITYNANGGSGTMAKSLIEDGNVNLTGNTFIYPGKYFTGWNTKADGVDGTAYADQAEITGLSGSLTLYAQWADATLQSISVKEGHEPKSSYTIGQCFNPAGLELSLNYDHDAAAGSAVYGTDEGFSFVPSLETALSESNIKVTISYAGKSVDYPITVSESMSFKLIKSSADLVAGAKYVIGATYSDADSFISTTQNGNNRGKLSLTVTNEVVAQADGLEVFILGGSTGQWTFSPMSANNTGKVIYAAGGSSSNYLRTDTLSSEDVGDKGRFTVEITEAGIAHITAIHATTTRNKLAYNDSNSIFSCYAGTPNNQGTPIGTIDLKIYRLIEANNFANVMLNSLATICDVEGVNTPLDSLKTAWKSFATSYASLSSFDKKTFKDGTGNFGGTKVEKAIALYDHIASVYNTRLESEGLDDYNFMSRSITPINNLAQPSNYVNTNASATAVIIIIAVVGTISLAGIYFIRRRKEDK